MTATEGAGATAAAAKSVFVKYRPVVGGGPVRGANLANQPTQMPGAARIVAAPQASLCPSRGRPLGQNGIE